MKLLTWSRAATGGTMAIVMILIVLYAAFMFGAVSGAHSAINESAQPISEKHSEVIEAKNEVQENIRANSTETEYLIYQATGLTAITGLAFDAGHAGIDFGYGHPHPVKAFAPYSAFPMYIGLLAMFYKPLKVLIGELRP